MKFLCEKDTLVAALSVSLQTVAPKSTIPALEGIYIHAGEDLYISGYNLETGITVTVHAEIQEYGKCIMPARLFFDIIRKLPGDDVRVEVDEKFKVTIQSGISLFTITAMTAEDYPEIPEVEFSNAVKLPQNKLKAMIGGTLFAVSEDRSRRPIYTGALIEVEENSITMVSVDGFRLAMRRYFPEEPTGRQMKFVVPAAALKEVEKILNDTDEEASFTLGRKHICFEVDNVSLICRRLEGEFGDWTSFMPKESPIELEAARTTLTASIDRVGLLVSEKFKSPVRCRFGSDTADFRMSTTIGEAHDVCSVKGEGKELEIGFNCRYLIDALRASDGEKVLLKLSNGLSPIVIAPSDGSDSFAYMVLPVRLKADEG